MKWLIVYDTEVLNYANRLSYRLFIHRKIHVVKTRATDVIDSLVQLGINLKEQIMPHRTSHFISASTLLESLRASTD